MERLVGSCELTWLAEKSKQLQVSFLHRKSGQDSEVSAARANTRSLCLDKGKQVKEVAKEDPGENQTTKRNGIQGKRT